MFLVTCDLKPRRKDGALRVVHYVKDGNCFQFLRKQEIDHLNRHLKLTMSQNVCATGLSALWEALNMFFFACQASIQQAPPQRFA